MGTSAGLSDRPGLKYSYCSSIATADCTGNNGNVTFQVIDAGPTQTYSYDSINRLQRVDETGGSQVWHQLFAYDPQGNRAVVNDGGTFMPYLYRTPRVASGTDPMPFVGNRWIDSTVGYDSSGNQNMASSGSVAESFGFDSENRMTQAITSAGTVNYSYDGEGHRATKTTSSGVEYFAYGADGELVWETGSGVTPEPCTRCFLTADHLGQRGW